MTPQGGRPLGSRDDPDLWQRVNVHDYRVEEIDSEQEELLRQGSRRSYVAKPEFYRTESRDSVDMDLAYGRHSSEEYFPRRLDRVDSDEEERNHRRLSNSQQMTLRSNEDELARRAQERIDKAKARGDARVDLSIQELEAYQRKMDRASGTESRRSSSKGGKSSPSLGAGAWTRRRSSSKGGLFSAITSAPRQPRGGTSSGKKRDSPPSREASTSGLGVESPGFLVPGLSGEPVYSPLAYHGTQTSRRESSGRPSPPVQMSRTASNGARYGRDYMSASQHDSREYHSSRHSSNASDYQPRLRHSTTSSRNSPAPGEYDTPPYPADTYSYGPAQGYSYGPGNTPAPGRRVISGPEPVAYSHVYRRPVPSSGDYPRGAVPHSTSDPALTSRIQTSSASGSYPAPRYRDASSEEESTGGEEFEPEPEPVREKRGTRSSGRTSSSATQQQLSERPVRRKKRS